MLNKAPFNTEVPQFQPSRDAPINSYITKKYPCQERLAGKTNEFRTLTWKIQQPDSSMVWQSVKVVLPMNIQGYHESLAGPGEPLEPNNMDVINSNPCCNIALSQSPMNAFRQTSLSLNGRIFSEENYYRDVLDTCYRGVGTQSYGDNHSLKPIVNRGITSAAPEEQHVQIQAYDEETDRYNPLYTTMGGDRYPQVVRTEDFQLQTVPSVNTLLEHNGPFIERARIFQDNLDYAGTTWSGEISHLLELGPFQARARKGNTAVPYIQDFHLRLNFAEQPSKFDVTNPPYTTTHGPTKSAFAGRTMAPKLLEFATLANFLHKGEIVRSMQGWPAGFTFTYTAQPYLEVTYTKHESGLRDSYNLRCFEHLYEKSQRFRLEAPAASLESPSVLSRVTSRLLSNPTKIYVWAEVADEFKYPYAMGGVRRSCTLENLHLRVNQRPDVMFNPSQEECYEMFRRHTNSNLEYGSWRKSPIYVFNMVDVGQPDMYANDARITWMEWDAEVKLTTLQMTEQPNFYAQDKLESIGYGITDGENYDFSKVKYFADFGLLTGCFDATFRPRIRDDDDTFFMSCLHRRTGLDQYRHTRLEDMGLLTGNTLRCAPNVVNEITGADVLLGTCTASSPSILGGIWAQVCTKAQAADSVAGTEAHAIGDIGSNAFFYIPESFRFRYETDSNRIFNDLNDMDWSAARFRFKPQAIPNIKRLIGTITFAGRGDPYKLAGEDVGSNEQGACSWAPGRFGYEITGGNIKNDVPLVYAKLPTCKQAGGNFQWICFGPTPNMPTMPAIGHAWTKWKVTKTQAEMKVDLAPEYWPAQTAGDTPVWGYGIEAMHGEFDCRWGARDKEIFKDKVVRIDPALFGGSLNWVDRIHATNKDTDMQMKVLYEYGNCQYNFSRSGAPTRILPNVVPVGPSPGIPQLD